MRVFATVLLSVSLAAAPLLAKNAGETGKDATPTAASSAPATAEKPKEALEEKFGARPSEVASSPIAAPAAITATTSASPVSAQGAPPAAAKPATPAQAEEKPSPLYFKIGAAEFYPLGFMDMTGFYRTTQLGGIGTNFGAIAFNNAVPAGRISETRFTAQ